MRKLFTSIAVAAVFLGPSPASAQSNVAYGLAYYSDAALTNQVGNYYFIGCDLYDNPQYHLDGQATNYSTSFYAGYCSGGVMHPI